MTNELDRALAAQHAPYPGSTTVCFASLAARLATRRRTVDRQYPPPPADRSQRAQLAFVDQLTEACAAQCGIDLPTSSAVRGLLQRSRFRLQHDLEPKRVNANRKLSTASWLAFCRACGQVSAHCPYRNRESCLDEFRLDQLR